MPPDSLTTLDRLFTSLLRQMDLVQTGPLERSETREIFDFRTMRTRSFNDVLAGDFPEHLLPIDRNATIEEIDAAVNSATATICKTMESSIRKFKPRAHVLPELPSDILDLIRQKRTVPRRIHDHQMYNILKVTERNLNQIIKERIVT